MDSRKHTRRISIIGQVGDSVRPDFRLSKQALVDSKLTQKLWKIMSQYIPIDVDTIQKNIVNHVQYTLGRTRLNFKRIHCYQAVAHSVRDRLIQHFNDSHRIFNQSGMKKINYLSLQFLIGRSLQNALINLNIQQCYRQALKQLGFLLQDLYEDQNDPGLGNGGLGRLAACFLDSLATLNYPAWGYGLRYSYGIFKQKINDGYQLQIPDYWLNDGNPWQIQRIDVQYPIHFYGISKKIYDKGRQRYIWEPKETILARAYDTPIPGYKTQNTIGLRLWNSVPNNQFDFLSFNIGDYEKALQQRQKASYITSVLYPNDSTYQGKQLRLKQQYLLVSASIQDILRRFKYHTPKEQFDWKNFPSKHAIQLNDTHPVLAIVQLLRLLVDIQKIEQQIAFEIVYKTFSYTNHTVLPQALQQWGVDLLGNLLPRHLEIIYLFNYLWLQKVERKFPGDFKKMSSLSIIQEGQPKKIRMANLGIVGSHIVNGVAALHTQLLKTTLFKDFYQFNKSKFQNKTNGVTPRRWIVCCNPALANFLSTYLSYN